MAIVPVMWSVWGALVLVMAVLFVYRASVTKNEEDQLFLTDSLPERSHKRRSWQRSTRFSPFCGSRLSLAGLATLFVVGYYIVDVINQFK